MVEWGIEQLTRRAGDFVAEAGFGDLAEQLDLQSIEKAGSALRQLFAGLPDLTEVSTFPIPKARLAELRG